MLDDGGNHAGDDGGTKPAVGTPVEPLDGYSDLLGSRARGFLREERMGLLAGTLDTVGRQMAIRPGGHSLRDRSTFRGALFFFE